MRHWLTHWFTRPTLEHQRSGSLPLIPATRGSGIPATPVEQILASQHNLIESIRYTLGLPSEEYTNFLAPVIERYATFVHLLPASQTHHHAGLGGLFRHGLEVAFWALRESDALVLSFDTDHMQRKRIEQRWRVAIVIAGLLHDVGKPVSDIVVRNRQKSITWQPCLMSLSQWLDQHHLDDYTLEWRHQRHQKHWLAALAVFDFMLPPSCRAYLASDGVDILLAMFNAMTGQDKSELIAELIHRADQRSVDKDLKENCALGLSQAIVPLELHLIEAMRSLLQEGQWSTNQKGSRVWQLQEGVHVVWKAACPEIQQRLLNEGITDFPRDPDRLADILIDRGLAIADVTEYQARRRYWQMMPTPLTTPLWMLRLSRAELLFPESVTAETETSRGVSDSTETVEECPRPKHSYQPAIESNDPCSTASESNPNDAEDANRREKAPTAEVALAEIPASDWLNGHPRRDDLIHVLQTLAEHSEESGIRWLHHQLWIPHPRTALMLHREAGEFIRLFDATGCLDSGGHPYMSFREWQGERGFLLTPAASQHVGRLLGLPRKKVTDDRTSSTHPTPEVADSTAPQQTLTRARAVLQNLPDPEHREPRPQRRKKKTPKPTT